VECPHLNDTVACNVEECPRPSVRTNDRDLVLEVPFGNEIRFNQLPGLDDIAMPGKLLSLNDLEEKLYAASERQALSSEVSVDISSLRADTSAEISTSQSTLSLETSNRIAAAVDKAEDELQTAHATLQTMITNGLNELAGALDDGTDSLETLIEDTAESLETALAGYTDTQVANAVNPIKAYMSNNLPGEILNVAKTQASEYAASALNTAKAYTDSSVSALSSAMTSADNSLTALINQKAAEGTAAVNAVNNRVNSLETKVNNQQLVFCPHITSSISNGRTNVHGQGVAGMTATVSAKLYI
jgi:uncharacterized protein YicC (UPF0701 family)